MGPSRHRGKWIAVAAAALCVGATGSASAAKLPRGLAPPTLEGPPVITALTPAAGPAEGGKFIKVRGTGFTGATEVKFGETKAEFTVFNSETISVDTPPAVYPVEDVRVVTPEGESELTPADEFTYKAGLAEISGVSPIGGAAAGGNSVVISGLDFFAVTAVKFGDGTAPSFIYEGPTTITAIAPPHTVERIDVSLESNFGPSWPEFCGQINGKHTRCEVRDHYKYLEPTVTDVSPSAGPIAGGASVTLTGTGFAVGETETEFTFGKAKATDVDCTSITTCTAVVPAGKKAGAATIVVKVNSNEPAKSSKKGATEYRYE